MFNRLIILLLITIFLIGGSIVYVIGLSDNPTLNYESGKNVASALSPYIQGFIFSSILTAVLSRFYQTWKARHLITAFIYAVFGIFISTFLYLLKVDEQSNNEVVAVAPLLYSGNEYAEVAIKESTQESAAQAINEVFSGLKSVCDQCSLGLITVFKYTEALPLYEKVFQTEPVQYYYAVNSIGVRLIYNKTDIESSRQNCNNVASNGAYSCIEPILFNK